MNEKSNASSIINFGYLLIFIGALFFVAYIYDLHSSIKYALPKYLLLVFYTYIFITGVLLVRKTILGYYFFKIFLYIFFLCFPIGTFISYITLSHLKKIDFKNKYILKSDG